MDLGKAEVAILERGPITYQKVRKKIANAVGSYGSGWGGLKTD